ncbi:MAG: tail fiber domain-containing protein [Planctomycetes bacterium]|nr:tail fiber domain-containing protein [Planctomycetota bacterium]
MNLHTVLTVAAATSLLAPAAFAQTGNTVHGAGAGASITTGSNLTLVGDSAGASTTLGQDQVMIGQNAGAAFTSHYRNTCVGARAGALGTGLRNVFVGAEAGEANAASYNTFLGGESGRFTTQGGKNTFIGFWSGRNHVSGESNVFIGAMAGRGVSAVTGGHNVAIGAYGNDDSFLLHDGVLMRTGAIAPGQSLTTGFANVLVGAGAGAEVSEGVGNTIVGHVAGNYTDKADFNTFVGCQAGYDNNATVNEDRASRNTYFGFGAGNANRGGEDNTGVGSFAAIGHTDRSRGVFLGARSRIVGNDAIAIGYQARVDTANGTAIGAYTSAPSGNEVVIGNDSTTSIGGSVNWTALSDGRVKVDVARDVPGLDFVRALRPVTYVLDTERAYELRGAEVPDSLERAAPTRRYTGFIAQEVLAAARESGFGFSGVALPAGHGGRYGLRYAEFVAPLVATVQELDVRVARQQVLIRRQAELLRRFRRVIANLGNDLSD